MGKLLQTIRRGEESGRHPRLTAALVERGSGSPFSEHLFTERTPMVSLSSAYPLSSLRNVTSGTVTHTGAEYKVDADSSLESAELGRYVPGYAAEIGLGVRIASFASGQVARWGSFDANDGVMWQADENTIEARIRRGGTDTVIDRADWNVDPLDGTGPSELNLDLADGHIFQVAWTWYGYGQIEWRLVDTRDARRQRIITVHRQEVAGSVSIDNPNLPLAVENDTAGSVHVGGRQFSIIGKYRPNERINAAANQSVSVTTAAGWVPVCSFRRKSATSFTPVSLVAEGFGLVTSQDVEVAMIVDDSLDANTSWAAPAFSDSDDTAIEVDTGAQSLTEDGLLLWRDVVHASGSGTNARGGTEQTIRTRIPRDQPVTLAARTISTDATVSGVLRCAEEW